MDALTAIINNIASSVASQVGGAVTSVLGYIVNGVQNDIIAPATKGIDDTLATIANGVDALQTAASKGIETTINAASSTIGTFISTAESGFTSVLGGVENGVQSLAQAIDTVFQSVVGGIEQGFTSISGAVGGAISTIGSDLQSGFEAFAKDVTDVFDPLFQAITSALEGLPADLEAIAGGIIDALTGIGKIFAPLIADLDTDITRKLPAAAEAYIAGVELRSKLPAQSNVTNQLPNLIQEMLGIAPSGDLTISLGRISLLAGLEAAIGMVEELFPGAAFIMASLLNHIADAVAVGDFRTLQQAGNQGTPNELLELSEATRARYRGIMSDGDYYDTMAKSGYTKARADVIYANAATLLGLNELVGLYKRGVIPDINTLYGEATKIQVNQDQVDNAVQLYNQLFGAGEAIQMWRRGVTVEGDAGPFDDMLRGGFTQARIDALKAISYNLPNVEQLKEFIIRDVDNDALAVKLGLDTGLDQSFYDAAAKVGFDPVTAKRIYRTTWQLPPFFILHTLYAAGKISNTDFTQLLTMQGFPPYFISSFASSLAPQLTQGNIKDMYKYEVIDADQIVPMLEQIGTPSALAAQLSELWQASVKLAAPVDQTQTQVDAANLKGESKGLVVTAYKDGILTNSAALSQLEGLGDTTEAAALRLSIADYQVAQLNIKQVYATDKDNYLAGNITIEQVLTDLTQAGATVAQQNQYFNDLQYAGRSKPKMPTESQLVAWYKGTFISLAQLADGLSLLGYADTWVPYFLLEAGAAVADIAALGYTVPTVS